MMTMWYLYLVYFYKSSAPGSEKYNFLYDSLDKLWSLMSSAEQELIEMALKITPDTLDAINKDYISAVEKHLERLDLLKTFD